MGLLNAPKPYPYGFTKKLYTPRIKKQIKNSLQNRKFQYIIRDALGHSLTVELTDSDSVSVGSNPAAPTKIQTPHMGVLILVCGVMVQSRNALRFDNE